MKTCSKCKQTRPVDCFPVRKQSADGRNRQCSSCLAEYQRNYSKTEKGAQVRARVNRSQQARIRAYITSLKKDKPCVDCGGYFHPEVLDFDHLPQFEKKENVSRMASKARTTEAIDREVAKCCLVCANCHRLRTFQRRSKALVG